MRLSLVLFFLATSQIVSAFELKTEFVENKSSIAILGISSSFQTADGSLAGTGVSVDFAHSFSEKTTLDISLSTALSQGKGVSSSFTGLSGYYFYNFFAGCCDRNKTFLVSGVPVVKETTYDPYLLQVGAGINQYFLNGSRGVYSSSGIGLGANFLFRAYGYQFKLSAKFSQMTSNDSEVKGTFLGAGLIFPL